MKISVLSFLKIPDFSYLAITIYLSNEIRLLNSWNNELYNFFFGRGDINRYYFEIFQFFYICRENQKWTVKNLKIYISLLFSFRILD